MSVKIQVAPTVVILPFRVPEDVEAYFDPQGRPKAPGSDLGMFLF